MKILVAPNSFKECSDSVNISNMIYENLKTKLKDKIILAPISDGGDGFTEVCNYYFKGRRLTYTISRPYDNSTFECEIFYSNDTGTVFIESANVLGLKIIPAKYRNPLLLSSKGIGEILRFLEKGAFPIEKVIVGIGGTGTIDMGLGACSVFGFNLFDKNMKELKIIPENFSKAVSIQWVKHNSPFRIKFVIDVNNPLIGENGAIRVFGKQKGADENAMATLESGFSNILNLLNDKQLLGSSKQLSGAGGGIPAGFRILFNSSNMDANNFILNNLGLKDKIEKADIIIIGEGSFDSQSIMGKGAGIILNEALKLRKDIVLICGKVKEKLKSSLGKNVKYFELQSYFNNTEESIKNYKTGIEKACEELVEMLK